MIVNNVLDYVLVQDVGYRVPPTVEVGEMSIAQAFHGANDVGEF